MVYIAFRTYIFFSMDDSSLLKCFKQSFAMCGVCPERFMFYAFLESRQLRWSKSIFVIRNKKQKNEKKKTQHCKFETTIFYCWV